MPIERSILKERTNKDERARGGESTTLLERAKWPERTNGPERPMVGPLVESIQSAGFPADQ